MDKYYMDLLYWNTLSVVEWELLTAEQWSMMEVSPGIFYVKNTYVHSNKLLDISTKLLALQKAQEEDILVGGTIQNIIVYQKPDMLFSLNKKLSALQRN